MHQIRFRAPLGSLQRSPDLLDGIKGGREERSGERRGEEGEEREEKWREKGKRKGRLAISVLVCFRRRCISSSQICLLLLRLRLTKWSSIKVNSLMCLTLHKFPTLRDKWRSIIICPIAIAYSMGQIIKSVCVCQSVSVYLSVCEHSRSRITWSIFTKIGTDVRTCKSKNEFVGGDYRTTPSPIVPSPQKIENLILSQKIPKIHANIKY